MRKSIAFGLVGALAAGAALVAAPEAKAQGFGVSVGYGPSYDDDRYYEQRYHGWNGGWGSGYRYAPVSSSYYGGYPAYRPAYNWGARPVVSGYYYRQAAPAWGYDDDYDDSYVVRRRVVAAPVYYQPRPIVRTQRVVYRQPAWRGQRVVHRQAPYGRLVNRADYYDPMVTGSVRRNSWR
jgi:hypothetical protein